MQTMTEAERQRQLYGAGRATRLKALELRDKLQSSHVLQDGEYNLAKNDQGHWQTSFNVDFPVSGYTLSSLSGKWLYRPLSFQ